MKIIERVNKVMPIESAIKLQQVNVERLKKEKDKNNLIKSKK